jgi:hypothetical protein
MAWHYLPGPWMGGEVQGVFFYIFHFPFHYLEVLGLGLGGRFSFL